MFDIPSAKSFEVREQIGHIIPAVATTTALVSGLTVLELLKIVKLFEQKVPGKVHLSLLRRIKYLWPFRWLSKVWRDYRVARSGPKLEVKYHEYRQSLGAFRNTYFDLSEPSFSFSEPAAAEVTKVGLEDEFSVWDFIQIPDKDLSNLTVRDIEAFLGNRFNAKLLSLTCNDVMVYAAFIPSFMQHRDCNLLDVLQSSRASSALKKCSRFLFLTVYCEDKDTGLEVPLPRLKVPMK